MAKYIPDSYLYRAIGADIEGRCGRCAQSRSDCMCHSLSRMDICGILEDAATVDVVEVKRGKWFHHEGTIICSECKAAYYDDIMEYTGDVVPKHCLNCGAKMEEKT